MKCNRCGEIIKRNSSTHKYCRECAIIHKRDYNKLLLRRKRSIGTSDFYNHRCKDMDREKEECARELSRIGIKRQFT